MSWTNNQSIRFRLGTVALYNILTQPVVDATNPALGLLKASFERMAGVHAGIENEFEEMTTRELPATLVACRRRKEMYS
jgi:hypothetical protein